MDGKGEVPPGHVPRRCSILNVVNTERVDPQWIHQGDGDYQPLQGDSPELSEGTVRRVFGQNTHPGVNLPRGGTAGSCYMHC